MVRITNHIASNTIHIYSLNEKFGNFSSNFIYCRNFYKKTVKGKWPKEYIFHTSCCLRCQTFGLYSQAIVKWAYTLPTRLQWLTKTTTRVKIKLPKKCQKIIERNENNILNIDNYFSRDSIQPSTPNIIFCSWE